MSAGDTQSLKMELEERDRELRRVLSLQAVILKHLRHDFRTPLNAILGISQIMAARMDGELTEEQEKQLAFIQKAARDLTDMVNKLMDQANAGEKAEHSAAFTAAFVEPEDEPGLTPAAARPGARNILVIEDSEADRYFLRRMLARHGVNIMEAELGQAGIDMAHEKNPDFIILDLSLPDMTGFDVLQALGGGGTAAHIPVIVRSSRILQDHEKTFLDARAQHIISKDSIYADEFQNLIVSLLEKPAGVAGGGA